VNEQCPHAERDNVISAMKRIGWENTHETKKVLLFEKDGFPIYFNGQDNGRIDFVFHPVLVGSNFEDFRDFDGASDRFMSNYRLLPQKPSPGQPLNYFGIGCKFPNVSSATAFISNLQIPVLK
jgi:hypothetical protein